MLCTMQNEKYSADFHMKVISSVPQNSTLPLPPSPAQILNKHNRTSTAFLINKKRSMAKIRMDVGHISCNLEGYA
jgi:hypothetical protein